MSEKNNIVEVKPIDGNMQVTVEEAKRLLKEHNTKVSNGNVNSFVSLKDINKIYPNGVQAVYDFNIDIEENDFIVLVGPSGCGKSTTLRMVAGLEDITSGYLYIDKVLSNYLSSKDRDISMVFQSYALYPQMSVYENIAFPLRARKYRKIKRAEAVEGCDQAVKALDEIEQTKVAIVEASDVAKGAKEICSYISTKLGVNDFASKFIYDNKEAISLGDVASLKENLATLRKEEEYKVTVNGHTINENYEVLNNGQVIEYEAKLTESEIREKVFDAARILDLGPYLDRRPKELSGGQMQRVALGRAIVRNAKLFLMDEPLSNLDAKLRVQMRSEIIKLHKRIGSTTIYVTHDQTEAMTMADRIVVMKGGYIQQIGTPREIYNNPANKFVAGFMGSPSMNFIDASLSLDKVNVGEYEIKLSQEQTEKLKSYYLNRVDSLNLEIEAYDNKIQELENRILESKDDKKESAKLELLHEKALTLKSGLLEELESINNFLAGEKIETILGIRPEDITLSLEEKEGYYKTSVDVTELLGKEQIVHFTMNSHEVLAQLSAKYEVNMQDELFVLFNNEHIHLFDKNNEETIL